MKWSVKWEYKMWWRSRALLIVTCSPSAQDTQRVDTTLQCTLSATLQHRSIPVSTWWNWKWALPVLSMAPIVECCESAEGCRNKSTRVYLLETSLTWCCPGRHWDCEWNQLVPPVQSRPQGDPAESDVDDVEERNTWILFCSVELNVVCTHPAVRCSHCSHHLFPSAQCQRQ